MERSPFFSVYILLRGTLAWSMESYFFRIQQLALYLKVLSHLWQESAVLPEQLLRMHSDMV